MKAFFGQEGNHAREHERYFQVLEAQGYDIQRFLKAYNAICYELIERYAPAKLSLAATAACEPYTAVMAEQALRYRWLDEYAPGVMSDLMLWHAVEEIEHRSVAFDVLQRVDDSWWLRAAGMFMSTVLLSAFWVAATSSLVAQDVARGELSLRSIRAQWKEIRRRRTQATGDSRSSIGRDVFWAGIRDYLRARTSTRTTIKHAAELAAAYVAERGLESADGEVKATGT